MYIRQPLQISGSGSRVKDTKFNILLNGVDWTELEGLVDGEGALHIFVKPDLEPLYGWIDTEQGEIHLFFASYLEPLCRLYRPYLAQLQTRLLQEIEENQRRLDAILRTDDRQEDTLKRLIREFKANQEKIREYT